MVIHFKFIYLSPHSKLINAVAPGTISKGLMNLKPKLNRYEVTENHVAALRYARTLGVRTVNMGPTDFMEGKVFLHNVVCHIIRLHSFSVFCGNLLE